MPIRRRALPFLFVAAFASNVLAQTSTWKEGYKQVVPSSTVNGLTPEGLFGEQISLYTGEVTFTATDVSIPGNNSLEVAFRRKLEMTDYQLLRGWEIDLPHLEGVYPEGVGWTRKNMLTGATGRCSSGSPRPPNAVGASVGSAATTSVWDPGEFWSGDHLSVPGAGKVELLKAQSTGAKLPTDGGTYKWVTKSGWRLSCIPAANDPGEGFLALAPDGTRYYFDWFDSVDETDLTRPGTIGPAPIAPNTSNRGGRGVKSSEAGPIATFSANSTDGLQRKRVLIYPSKVVDRFGNYVNYLYNAAGPTSITSSDGRAIAITYGNPMTVVANGRTWSYHTDSAGIYRITLPDGSKWTYNLKAVLNSQFTYPEGSSNGALATALMACDKTPPPNGTGGTGITGSVTHPSGAVGTFVFVPVQHGRSKVDRSCLGYYVENGWYYGYAYHPYLFSTRSLKSKTISGPGLTTATWNYSYGPANSSWSSNCGAGCATTKHVDVVNPLGVRTRHIFSNQWHAGEGLEIATEIYDAGGVLREQTNRYYHLVTEGQAYPAEIGMSGNMRGDGSSERFDPLRESRISRDGRVFTWRVANDCLADGQATYCFDELARPTKIVKTSSSP